MIELLNRYAQGLVVVPVVAACRRRGLFDLLGPREGLSLETIARKLSANSGHLAAALRMLHGLGWLERGSDGNYVPGPSASELEAVPDELVSLLTFPGEAYLRGEDSLTLAPWLDLSATRWDSSDRVLADQLDGVLLGRVLLALGGIGDETVSATRFESRPLFESTPEPARHELRKVFRDREWTSGEGGELHLNGTGRYVLEHAVVLALAASYAPMLSRIEELLFGDASAPFSQAGTESHVDRALNVRASGFLHRRYFDGVRDIVASIFDTKPFEAQPRYVVDTGCGDGTFLRSIYETVLSRTARGETLDRYPLVLVGVDLNDAALEEAETSLADLPHVLLRGDVADPKGIEAELERHGIAPDDVLHVRSFLDHDSHLTRVTDRLAARARAGVPYRGVSVSPTGELVPQSVIMQGLVEHLTRWGNVVTRHGVIVLDVHAVDPVTASRYRESTESLSFDAFQAFSLQYLVEASDFVLAAAEAGLFARPTFARRYPAALPFTRISLNWFEKRPYRARLASAADIPSLMEIEAAAWPEALSASREEIERRLLTDPRGQIVVELEGRLVAVLYSQRIESISDLEGTTHRDVGSIARDDGPVLQLLGLFVHPSVHHLGIGDQLLELALQLAEVTAEIEVVTGVTRCRDYSNHRDISFEEYVRRMAGASLPVDPIPLLHTSHGARIVKVIPGHRPEDVDNEGAGVLVTYDVRGESGSRASATGRDKRGDEIHAADEEPAASKIEKAIRKVLRAERESIFSSSRALMDMGLDSADLLELRVLLGELFALELDPTLFFRYPSADRLASYLATRERAEPAPRVTPPPAEATPIFAKSEPRRRDVPARAPLAPLTMTSSPIAIVGIDCRFPGAANVGRYWELLREGRDAVTEAPGDRPWLLESPNARFGGFLPSIDRFDASLFGLSRREANHVDPQQRLLLETCWTALENAGIAPPSLEGTRTGVFLGIMSHDYELLQVRGGTLGADAGSYFASGNSLAIAAGRLAYVFGLRGPAISVDTACSSSLVAVHLAAESLVRGESEVAIAAGVQLLLAPELTASYAKAGMLSPDGRCKTFDASANGYVRSEGVGAVVLKRLDDALRDGDDIVAVLRGSALNQDGSSNGLTAPSAAAQEEVIREALRKAELSPSEISYVEAHGTGTSLGDPIEFDALAAVYGESRNEDNPLYLGSVKTNIGHTEAAAGMAGLIKVALALRHAEIPAHLHFERPNPSIDLARIPARIPRTTVDWSLAKGATSRLAAVSSFGFSGTNAHVVLEEWLRPPPPVPSGRRPLHGLTVSAANEASLRDLASSYAEHLRRDDPEFGDFAFSVNTGRAQFEERAVILARSSAEAAEKIDRLLQTRAPAPGVHRARVSPTASPTVAFLFTGQGSQFAEMGKELFSSEPVFRRSLERCDELSKGRLTGGLLAALFPSMEGGLPHTSIDETAYTQPVLFAFEYALAELWRSWGVEPACVLGHSVGEYAAACVAGILDLESALDLVVERGRLMQELPEKGAMAAVGATESDVANWIESFGGDLSIAAVNAPSSVVVSGRSGALHELRKGLESRGVRVTPLKVSNAFHSALMEPMLGPLEAEATKLEPRASSIRLVSNLDGRIVTPDSLTPDYWARHARQTVRFSDGVRTLVANGCDTFVEIGSGTTLLTLSRMSAAGVPAAWLPSLRPGVTDWESMLSSLAELHLRGVNIDWLRYDAPHARRRINVPNYPFSRERYWFDEGAPRSSEASHKRDSDDTASIESLLAEVERLSEVDLRQALQPDGNGNGNGGGPSDLERRLTGLSPERLTLFLRKLAVRRSRDVSERNVVHDYYDSLSGVWRDEKAREYEAHERFLTFGVLPAVVPGFSWSRTLTDPEHDPEHFRLALEAQKELRSLLFGKNDLQGRRVLDIGCGYGSDLVSLAQASSELTAVGYTLSDRQAEIARRKVKELGLEARVSITKGDSSRDAFPGQFDVVIGFEVAHHVRDKSALFANVAEHLVDRGTVLLADFVSNAAFAIEHRETSSFFVRKDEWVELLAPRGLVVEESVDVSREIANFLEDSEFQTTLRRIAEKGGEDVRQAFRSYDQLGRLLRKELASYVLLTLRKRPDMTADERASASLQTLEHPLRYADVSSRGAAYRITWSEVEKTSEETEGHLAPSAALVVDDTRGLGSELARELEKDGLPVALAAPGDRFERLSKNRWRVRLGHAEDLQRFVAEATPPGTSSLRVAYLPSLDAVADEADETDKGRPENSLEWGHGPFGLLHVSQALARTHVSAVRLLVVTHGCQGALGDEPVAVAQSPVTGFVASLRREQPGWSTIHLDLDPERGPDVTQVREHLLRGSEPEIAIRGGARLRPRLERRIVPSMQGEFGFGEDTTTLITGGMGGIGLRIAAWAVARGARHLVLCGRGKPSSHARDVIAELRGAGAEVVVERADVSLDKDVERLMATLDAMAPLRAIFHAAGTSDDATIASLTRGRLRDACSAKVRGAWNLHRATLGIPLDLFVLCSSVVAVLGNAGQAAYGAANAFLDALAERRMRQGRPASSIAWGPWASVGMAARLDEKDARRWEEMGFTPMDPEVAMRGLEQILSLSPAAPRALVAVVDWDRYRTIAGESPLIEALVSRAKDGDGTAASLRDKLLRSTARKRRQLLVEHVRLEVAKVLGSYSARSIDPEKGFSSLGMDSLMSVELRNRLQSSLGLTLSSTLTMDYPNVTTLATHLDGRLTPSTIEDRASSASRSSLEETDLAGLSESEAQLLLETLKELEH